MRPSRVKLLRSCLIDVVLAFVAGIALALLLWDLVRIARHA